MWSRFSNFPFISLDEPFNKWSYPNKEELTKWTLFIDKVSNIKLIVTSSLFKIKETNRV